MARKRKRNVSIRFTKKAYVKAGRRSQGKQIVRHIKGRTANPSVYDSAGKLVGKFSRKAAKIVARAVGGSVGKPKAAKNPAVALFKSPAAAKKYAAAHGLKVKSIRKVKRVR